MIIKLFKFTKRENSTKRPTLSDGTDFNCVLKEQTSVVSPAVTINFGNKTSFTFDYNYAYIPEFKRYYYISDMVSDGYNWNVYMQSDVLATFKDTIGSTSLYVLRASAAFDGNIIDNTYPAKVVYSNNIQAKNLPWNNDGTDSGWPSVANGTFIIGAVSSSGTQGRYGSVRYYEMDATNLAALCNSLLSDTILSGFSANDGTLELQKAIIDPLSYIKSCIWVPRAYDPTFVTTGLPIWKWIATCDYHPLQDNPPWDLTSIGFDLPKHPLAATRGNYLNGSPYTKLTLSLPPFGLIELDTSKTANTQRISVVLCTDLITGAAICDITTQEGIFLGKYTAQVGVPIQLSQVMRDYVGAGTQFAQAGLQDVAGIASAISGSDAAAAGHLISSVSSMIGGVSSLMRPLESSRGSNGGFADLRGRAILEGSFYTPVDEDNTHLGRPLCQNRTPASLGGYILAREGDVEIEGYATEQASVKAYLEGGFFYE